MAKLLNFMYVYLSKVVFNFLKLKKKKDSNYSWSSWAHIPQLSSVTVSPAYTQPASLCLHLPDCAVSIHPASQASEQNPHIKGVA